MSASFYTDAENVWSSNRSRLIARRNEASRRIAERAAEKAAKRLAIENGGALPIGDPRHIVEPGLTTGDYIAGILFADGAVHLFDRIKRDHAKYARSIGRPGVMCGCDRGEAGWGFYLRDTEGQTFDPYRVPERFQAATEAVVKSLLAGLAGPRLGDRYRCTCGRDAEGNGCTWCGLSRGDMEWFLEQEAKQATKVPVLVDPVPPVVVETQAQDWKKARQSAAAKKAWATRRRNAAMKAARS